MGKPRIAEEDYLVAEDLLEGSLVGEWVRIPMYSEGHRVSIDPTSAFCGKPLVIDEWWYEHFRGFMRSHFGPKRDPGDWYYALDRRSTAKCSACKGPDLQVVKAPRPVDTTSRPVNTLTPADRVTHSRFLSQVARVARELGATIEVGFLST